MDEELDACINRHTTDISPKYAEMMRYQLGWNGKTFDVALSGKRVRALILLLATHALGGDWEQAIPAAAAMELVHNFSLVHDDIQDRSNKRRGRDTVWVKWGEAQAINTGDAMLALANLEILSMTANCSSSTVLNIARLLSQAVYNLTKGQFLDLAHENAEDVTLSEYFKMVEGKTSALFSACFGIGALLAGKKENEIDNFKTMGTKLGLAFQIQDDYLGIWGQDKETGKSSESDLLSKKKSYPAHYALENLPDVLDYWSSHVVFNSRDVLWIKKRLEEAGIDAVTLAAAKGYYEESLLDFQRLFINKKRCVELRSLIESLFSRTR